MTTAESERLAFNVDAGTNSSDSSFGDLRFSQCIPEGKRTERI